ncbi:MAG TPA: alpha-galactosidase [Euzebyales bacterium]|nr:alpha-galactosidase [Euzebyales bacterium]
MSERPSASAEQRAVSDGRRHLPDTGIVHLREDGVSIVVDARGSRLPAVLHWGAPLGAMADADVEALADHLVPPPSHSGLDTRVLLTLLPEPSAGHPGRPGVRGHRAGAAWSPSFTLTAVEWTGERAIACTADDALTGLRLVTELELTGSGLLRLRHRLRNTAAQPYAIEALEAALPLPAQATEVLDFTGRWCRERHPQRHPLAMGSWVRESRRGRTGHDATLGLLVGTAGFSFGHGEIWGVHVAWSGNHVTWAESLPERHAVLGGGELLGSGEVTLEQDAVYTTPWIYAAYSGQGLDGIGAAFHGWLRSRPHHPGPQRPRPVILNTWEAVYFDHDLDRLRRLADVAAQIGVERFVLDDGWFSGRRDDTAGLGDWFVDEAVWPSGLDPIIAHVRGLGMQFGLWVEPEMINPDSDLYRAHPDWVLGPRERALPPPRRNQHVLDLATPQAYAYVLERLDALLTANDIAYLKWDHNRDLVDADHDGRAGVHAQTRAVYRLLGELRARHPGVEIESCSSGGGRVDLEILEHTERVWASDCNDALERQAIQRWTGLFLPPELIGAHVGPPRAHTTGRTHDLAFRVATALFGHFGLEWDITTASDEDLGALARAIAFYKQARGLLHTGMVVHADHPDPSAWVHGVVTPDRSRALYCLAQLATSPWSAPPPARLPGLADDRAYRVRVEAPAGGAHTVERVSPAWMVGDGIVLSGRLLSTVGLPAPSISPEQAVLIGVEATTDGAGVG